MADKMGGLPQWYLIRCSTSIEGQLVVRSRAVRKANYDGEGARMMRIDSKSILVNGTLATSARTACVCRRFAPRLNCRHADFQNGGGGPSALSFSKLPARPMVKLWLIDKFGSWNLAVGNGTRESQHRAVQTEAPRRSTGTRDGRQVVSTAHATHG